MFGVLGLAVLLIISACLAVVPGAPNPTPSSIGYGAGAFCLGLLIMFSASSVTDWLAFSGVCFYLYVLLNFTSKIAADAMGDDWNTYHTVVGSLFIVYSVLSAYRVMSSPTPNWVTLLLSAVTILFWTFIYMQYKQGTFFVVEGLRM
jgi:hypothetical protein